MKKFALTSMVAIMATSPAFAESFPSNGYMLENKTYDNAATSTNMAGVYENSVNADANYDNCPAGYWCDASGQHACSTAGDGSYTSSAAGANENTACYKSCTVATANIAHATGVSGNDYYDTGTDTCSATSCENGYHTESLNLEAEIGTVASSNTGYIGNNGNMTHNDTTYGLTQNGEFAVEYSSEIGTIKGRSKCSSQGVENIYYENNDTFSSDHFVSTLPDSYGENCWCTLDEYTTVDGVSMSLSGPWVFNSGGPTNACAGSCAWYCALRLGYNTKSGYLAFRSAILGSVTVDGAPNTCAANTITINWSGASAADIAANEAGTVTYGGDIRTPRAAEIIPGKVFTGWTFSAPGE